ncbi:hypothetical protein [Sinorhizobium sp. BJ1]|uniref:hypothetical protein n=1 Tax=Sinorhizobium sp. BJ1 TaxID=2035455 RepID=UPI000BE85440|nr:hypothetical protein [Sinorhizobium sp. BJ1]PDT80594.1 hypothetical protein CO676_26705 [Sinorhizobium sp. BJ1]
MGKVHKRAWPGGKNLKPVPRGRTPVQAIPGPRPRSAEERRQKEEYRLALAKGLYPLGEELLTLQTSMQQARAETMEAFFLSGSVMSTNSETPQALTAEALLAIVDLVKGTPAPRREPIEVTEAEYQALKELPVATTPQELAILASIYGTAVMVVKPQAVLTGKLT